MKLVLVAALLLPIISHSKQLQKPEIYQSAAPTNLPRTQIATGATCYLAFKNAKDESVAANWAFSTRRGWTTETANHQGPTPNPAASCTSTNCTATQIIEQLAGGVTYYFAAKEIDETTSASSRWSNEVACKPPIAESMPSSPTDVHADAQIDPETETQE